MRKKNNRFKSNKTDFSILLRAWSPEMLANCIENNCLWKCQINCRTSSMPVCLIFPFHCLFFLVHVLGFSFVMSGYWLVSKFNADLNYVHFIVIVTTVDFVNNVATDSSCQMSLHRNFVYKYSRMAIFTYIFFSRCRVLFFPLSRALTLFHSRAFWFTKAIFHVFKHVIWLFDSTLTNFNRNSKRHFCCCRHHFFFALCHAPINSHCFWTWKRVSKSWIFSRVIFTIIS